jgi:hypothetical protein
MPVRRHPLRPYVRADAYQHLLVPHVPESIGQLLPGLYRCSARRLRVDPRAPRHLPLIGSRRTRLLRIEPAELHRVYPLAQSNGAGGNETRHDATAEVATATAALIVARDRAELAEQRLADFKVMFEDMRQDRDHWRVHAGRLALADARARQPWWRRLAGLPNLPKP